MLKIIALIAIVIAFAHCSPVVQTSKGKVQGTLMNTFTNKTFYAFMGIPFAKPPVGDLRFEAPKSPEPWEGIFDDRGVNKKCIQDSPSQTDEEDEDCLYLHVYTPQLQTENKNVSLPVMYVIHGGAFVAGTSGMSQMGPQYLMDYDVIVVSVSYRLGFFGFISTGDLTCPGNNGLKDQLFGLKWVNENIQLFGGDPKKITIFGESAGAASVGYQLLSPQSKGLFRSAIQNSGSAVSPWMLQRSPRDNAYKFAKILNSTIDEANTTSEELMNFLRTLNVGEVKKAVNILFGSGMIAPFYKTMSGFLFGGVIEPKHNDAFLSDLPYGKMVSGDFNAVPTLIGINSEEALFLVADENLQKRVKYYDENPALFVAPDMHLEDLELKTKVGEEIRNIYVKNNSLHESVGLSIKYFSDATFGRSALKQAKLASNFTDVFFYEFDYLSNESFHPKPIPGAGRVVHAGDMAYLFHTSNDPNPYTKPQLDITTMDRMLTMWTNFVKYQNPAPEPLDILQNITWPKISTESKIPYLLINETLEVKYDLKKSMVDEYEKLYKLYAVPPLDTY